MDSYILNFIFFLPDNISIQEWSSFAHLHVGCNVRRFIETYEHDGLVIVYSGVVDPAGRTRNVLAKSDLKYLVVPDPRSDCFFLHENLGVEVVLNFTCYLRKALKKLKSLDSHFAKFKSVDSDPECPESRFRIW